AVVISNMGNSPRPSRNVTFAGAGICDVFTITFCFATFTTFPAYAIPKIPFFHNFFTNLLPPSDTSVPQRRQISSYEKDILSDDAQRSFHMDAGPPIDRFHGSQHIGSRQTGRPGPRRDLK